MNILTIASLDAVESLGTGAFCLNKFTSFAIGPEFLLRAGSDEDQPACLPSSPPKQKFPHKNEKTEINDNIKEHKIYIEYLIDC